MTVTQEMLASSVADLGDVPLGTDLAIDDEEYARIMRRIGIAGGDPGASVSAFNSSI